MKYILIPLLISTRLFAQELITPIPLTAQYNHAKALLGKKLFFDTRLSHDNTISCASCHFLDEGGDDNIAISIGINGKKGVRNAPTVLNALYNVNQFWDGRAKSLKDQVRSPIHNSFEMGSNFDEVIEKLSKDSDYVNSFKSLYRDQITGNNISDAIAEFEKTLITPNARFDKFLRGDKEALNANELNGYRIFKEYGCISCHNGVNIGGNLMQKMGAVEEYETSDLGRFNVTKRERDKFYFKVPSLRNVELTAPYSHDGSVKTLKSAVEVVLKYQVGIHLTDEEVDDIIKFLKTLTGESIKIIEEKR